ncbi:MAG TPA: hypothetical protein VKA95_14535 [Nitrososphaeraceae archaeon]|nr:hypothetical protein [Nitrososphaeraceae archaeon]
MWGFESIIIIVRGVHALQCTQSIIVEQNAIDSMSQQADTNSTHNVVNEPIMIHYRYRKNQ